MPTPRRSFSNCRPKAEILRARDRDAYASSACSRTPVRIRAARTGVPPHHAHHPEGDVAFVVALRSVAILQLWGLDRQGRGNLRRRLVLSYADALQRPDARRLQVA